MYMIRFSGYSLPAASATACSQTSPATEARPFRTALVARDVAYSRSARRACMDGSEQGRKRRTSPRRSPHGAGCIFRRVLASRSVPPSVWAAVLKAAMDGWTCADLRWQGPHCCFGCPTSKGSIRHYPHLMCVCVLCVGSCVGGQSCAWPDVWGILQP